MRKPALFFLALAAAMPLGAEPGLTGAGVLAVPLGARATAMGQAYAGADGTMDSLGYNPAGLSSIKRPSLETAFTNGIVDDHLSFTAYAQPLPFGVLSAGFLYYDAGSIDLNLSSGVTGKVKAEQDFVELASLALPLPAGLSAGATAKHYSLDLAQQAHASGMAFDLGLQWRTPLPGLSLGAAAQNLGEDVKFEQQGDPLPSAERTGLAYRFDSHPTWGRGSIDYLLTADLIKLKDQRTAAGAGVELGMPVGGGEAALRLGYLFSRDTDSVTAGIGLKEGRFFLNYALGVKRSVNDVHNVSVGVEF